jgi:hypothetical protein
VTLSEPATSTVTVHYTVTDGTATGGTKPGNGADYKLKSGTITFTPNVRTGLTPISKQVAVTVWGGTGSEPDETLVVTLDTPTGGPTLARAVATGTIIDDDATTGTKLGIGDGSIVSARAGSQSVKFPVSLSLVPGTNVTVDYTVVPGTATYSKKASGGGDFGGKVSGTLTFLAGKGPLKNIAIPVWPDAVAEADQSFTITLSNLQGSGVTLIRATGTGTIIGIP